MVQSRGVAGKPGGLGPSHRACPRDVAGADRRGAEARPRVDPDQLGQGLTVTAESVGRSRCLPCNAGTASAGSDSSCERSCPSPSLLVGRAAIASPRIAPALTRGARGAARQLDQSLRRLTIRLFELAPLAICLFGESLHARIGCQALGDRGPVIAVNLLDAATACIAPLGRAGGMVALLGGADHAIELEGIAWLRVLARDVADISLVGILTRDAVACVFGQSGRRRANREARGNSHRPKAY